MPLVTLKINDRLVEFSTETDHTGTPLRYRVLTDEQAAEYYLLQKTTNKTDCELQTELETMVATATEEVKASFTKSLKSSVMRTLGFENNWSDGWKVDHCNQRMSTINDMVSSEVRAFVADQVTKAAMSFSQEEMTEMVLVIKEDLRGYIKEKLREQTRQVMNNQVKELVNKIVTEQLNNQEIEVRKSIMDILRNPVAQKPKKH